MSRRSRNIVFAPTGVHPSSRPAFSSGESGIWLDRSLELGPLRDCLPGRWAMAGRGSLCIWVIPGSAESLSGFCHEIPLVNTRIPC